MKQALEAFQLYKSGPRVGRYTPDCKGCRAIRNKAWQAANPEKMRGYHRRWRSENLEHERTYKRERYRADVIKGRAEQKRWRDAHPEEMKIRNEQRAAKMRSEGLYAWYRHGLSPEMRAELMARQDGKCAICRRDLAPLRKRTVDHDHATNKIRGILCARCNGCVGWYELHRSEALAYLDATDQHLEPDRRPSGRTEWKPF